MTEVPNVAPGWYPDGLDPTGQRYWDGTAWTEQVLPPVPPVPAVPAVPPGAESRRLIIVAILTAVAIGLTMSLQSVSLLTGTGTVVTGAVIAGAAAVASLAVRGLPLWLRIMAVLLAALAIASVVYDEVQLQQRRDDLRNVFQTP